MIKINKFLGELIGELILDTINMSQSVATQSLASEELSQRNDCCALCHVDDMQIAIKVILLLRILHLGGHELCRLLSSRIG